jgi:hypothetical protein
MSWIRTRLILPLSLFVSLLGCSQSAPKPRVTASEEFHLRGECVKLAGQLQKDVGPTAPGISDNWSSNYKAEDNRCYVLDTWVLDSDSFPSSNGDNEIVEKLYDGQTKVNLANTSYKYNEKSGDHFYTGDVNGTELKTSCTGGDGCYQAVHQAIQQVMKRDDQ